MAIPSPLSRPALLRISERERCPKMIARIDMGNTKRKSPQIRLTIAFPLVSGGAASAEFFTTGAVVADAGTSFPQTLQNFSPAATLFPQPEQNTRHDLPSLGTRQIRLPKFSKNSTPLDEPRQSVRGIRPVCLAAPRSDKVRGSGLYHKYGFKNADRLPRVRCRDARYRRFLSRLRPPDAPSRASARQCGSAA